MIVEQTGISGVVVIRPKVFCDNRGYFMESYNAEEFARDVADVRFVQDNESRSVRGVIRGLHFQAPPMAQAKLVRCVEGRLLDVVVDIRRGSSTYGQHVAVELSAENKLQVFIPKGFAHGFAVLSETAVMQYKCDNFYAPQTEGGINILDRALGIDWQIRPEDAILSEKDTRNPMWADFVSPFKL